MNLKIKFLRFLVKRQWKTGKRFPLKNKLSSDENKIISLIKKKSRNINVDILTDPVFNKRYIIDKKNNIYIIMENYKISLMTINNKLYYYFDANIIEYIWNYVDKQINKKRIRLEKEIDEMVGVSLDRIIRNNNNNNNNNNIH